MRRIGRQTACLLLAAVLAGVALAGCGQKGPLYQPGSRDQKPSEPADSHDKQSVPRVERSGDESSPGETGDPASNPASNPVNDNTHNE